MIIRKKKTMQPKRVLVTTSDYLPQFGGLTTYTLNLVKALEQIGFETEVFHWKNIGDIKGYRISDDIDLVFNVHMMASYFGTWDKKLNVNIIHGSEILFYSPNPFKRLYKRLFKTKILKALEDSRMNIFISEFTFKKLKSLRFSEDYSRDYILHNCIDDSEGEYIENDINDEIVFSFFARNVPHKNPRGVSKYLENLKESLGKEVRLITNVDAFKDVNFKTSLITNLSEEKKELSYKEAHFNILFSLDHSHLGFFEGFGLTCLEAGKYGVPSLVSHFGGLSENVHDGYNGYVIDLENPRFSIMERYNDLRKFTYQHTMDSHGLEYFKRFLKAHLGFKNE